MAIYFAEEFDDRTPRNDDHLHLGVEFDLSTRFATGNNMFGPGMRPPMRWRSSSPFHVPTALGFRVKNLATLSRSVAWNVLSLIARRTLRWK